MSLQIGDRVTWTHLYRQGKSATLTTRTGKIISVGNDGFVTVKFRGKIIYLRADRVRPEGKTTELTDMVMGKLSIPAPQTGEEGGELS